jgi:hypothetical protein
MPDFKCGTHAGYMRHYRAGEKPCGACLIAARIATNARMYQARHPDGRPVWILSLSCLDEADAAAVKAAFSA